MSIIDFSFSRPSVAQLHAAGVTAVGRYLAPLSSGKGLSALEFAAYIFNGISVWVVFENTANDAAGGFSAGVTNAKNALAYAQAINWPTSRPIYFAVDTSIVPQSAVAYFQGINSILPQSRTGVYGEGALAQLLAQDGLADWYWQSESTSFPGNSTTLLITHIQQTTANPPIAGTDLDYAAKADFGQYPGPNPPPPPPSPISRGVNMAVSAPGGGQYAVRSDGGVFCYEGAPFFGSLPGDNVHVSNIIGIAPTKTGKGYWLAGSDGGVYAFGDAPFHGSLPEHPSYNAGGPSDPCVGIALDSSHAYGYVLVCDNGASTGPSTYYFNETTT